MDTQSTLIITILAILFVGTHIGFATRGVRAPLVARLGEHGFVVLFSVIASLSYAAVVAYYAAHRGDGPSGLALGAFPVLRPILVGMSVLGIVLMVTTFGAYFGSPYDVLARRIRAPYGVERITRHPFFAGLTLFAVAHALLATRVIGMVVFIALALLAVGGAYHQDRKLRARCGPPYDEWLAATSAVPFAAIAAGRQRLVAAELPFGHIAAGLGAALVLRTIHDAIFANGGLWVIVAVVGGAALISWQSARHARRVESHPAITRPAGATVR